MNRRLLPLALLLLAPVSALAESWVYYTSSHAPSGHVRRVRLNGTGDQLVAAELNAQGLAIDSVNEKVYFTRQGPHEVRRADLDGSNPETVVEASAELLAVAPEANLLFWSDWEGRIWRTTLDGEGMSLIAQAGEDRASVTSLFVDELRERVYWTVGGESCELIRASYEGEVEETPVVSISGCREMVATINASQGRLYWQTRETGVVSADLAGENRVSLANLEADRGLAVEREFSTVVGAEGIGKIWRLSKENTREEVHLDGSNGQIAVWTSPAPMLERIRPVEPGAVCAAGGHVFEQGRDDGAAGETARDGILGDGEVDVVTPLCHGLDAAQALVSVTRFEVDERCPAGGVWIEAGVDDGRWGGTAGDGRLQPGEILAGTVACDGERGEDGADGEDGQDGEDGFSTLLRTQDLASSDERCVAGGVLVEAGLDDGSGGGIARNGVLEDGEVRSETVVCHGVAGVDGEDGAEGKTGADGADGKNGADGQNGKDAATPLFASNAVAAGQECAAGGTRIEAGLDDGKGEGVEGDGTLQPGEVRTSTLVCNGVTGPSGPAASGCATGGAGILALAALVPWMRRRKHAR